MSKASAKSPAVERRRAPRRPVLETFACFAVIPQHGIHRLTVHDISEDGIGFDLDTDAEFRTEFSVQNGDELDIRFYVNPTLYIPLVIKVTRMEDNLSIRRVGAIFQKKNGSDYKAFLAFVTLIDRILETLRTDPNSANSSS